MNIVIANDHAAVELKQLIVHWLEQGGHRVKDLGVADGERADYPDMGRQAAEEYLRGGYNFGIALCGTGIGISISANKVRGIRCALPQNVYAACMAREHNLVNMIAFGGRIHYPESPIEMLEAFMSTEADPDDRHRLRVDKIMAIENQG